MRNANKTTQLSSPPFTRRAQPAIAICVLALVAGCATDPPAPSKATAGPVEAARAAQRAGQFDAAIADADDYLRGQPNGPLSAEAYLIKGSSFLQKDAGNGTEARRNLFEAKSAYIAALNARPNKELEGYIRTGLSNVALFQDDFPTCVEQATRAAPLVNDPGMKAGLLYNTGLAQQRLSRFSDADQTFRQVMQRFPGTPLAAAARQHEGRKLFYVQLGWFPSAAAADQAMLSLRTSTAVVSRQTDSAGRTVLDVGPFSTYPNAKQQRDALIGTFPAATVVP